MTAQSDPPAPPDEPKQSFELLPAVPPLLPRPVQRTRPLTGSGRRGRPLGPITDACSSPHRAWLEPLREAYLASGLTMSQLAASLPLAKSKVSELMSGRLYPRWEILYALAVELRMPYAPLFRLWRQAAVETQNRSRSWVDDSVARTTVTTATPAAPPMEHRAFRNLNEARYRLYTSVFLPDEERLGRVITDTFDRLWLTWRQALASPDARRYAWTVLRSTVMSRTHHLDGRPDFTDAAFDTVALRSHTDEDAAMSQLSETRALFAAMGRLPDNQLDVMVLRRVCGISTAETCDVLGVPLALVRSDERHATRVLDLALDPSPDLEGNLE